jgi:hypothetical protein
MSKYILIPFLIVIVSIMTMLLWIKHPIKSFKQLRKSWNLVMKGIDE